MCMCLSAMPDKRNAIPWTNKKVVINISEKVSYVHFEQIITIASQSAD